MITLFTFSWSYSLKFGVLEPKNSDLGLALHSKIETKPTPFLLLRPTRAPHPSRPRAQPGQQRARARCCCAWLFAWLRVGCARGCASFLWL